MTDYFTKLGIIWDELDNFKHNPICVHQDVYCSPCHKSKKM